MAAVTPVSLVSLEAPRLRGLHSIYAITALASGETLTHAPYGAGGTTAPLDIAATLTAGDLSVNRASDTTILFGSATPATGNLHLFGRRLSAAGGTGAARVALWNDERARKYQSKRHLIFEFASMTAGDTWTSKMRAEVYDFAWQDTGAAISGPTYTPATGVFTFTASSGSPQGLLHVWAHG